MGKRTGIMLCYPYEEKRLEKWNDVVLVQPKLDGERCRFFIQEDPLLLSSEGEDKTFALPSLVESGRILFLLWGRKIELDGELYVHGWDFNDIHSVVSRSVNLHPLSSSIEFHCFDIIDLLTPQLERTKALVELSKLFPPNIRMVRTIPAESNIEVRNLFTEFISQDYEGIIIRNINAPYVRKRSTAIMKFKPKKSDIYDIIGYVEGKGKYEGTIGTLLCRDDMGTTFEIGSFGVTDNQRLGLWEMREELSYYSCKVTYQHKWSSGKPKNAIFIELIDRRNAPPDINPLL